MRRFIDVLADDYQLMAENIEHHAFEVREVFTYMCSPAELADRDQRISAFFKRTLLPDAHHYRAEAQRLRGNSPCSS